MTDQTTASTQDVTPKLQLRGIDLRPVGLNCWAVSLFVPTSMLSSLRGEKIIGIEANPNGASGRMRPKFDRVANGFLDKAFVIYVPCKAGQYDLSASFPEGERSHYESCQVVVVGDDKDATISRQGYGEMIESFGGERLVRAVASQTQQAL